jgi:ankyrin repeat protein
LDALLNALDGNDVDRVRDLLRSEPSLARERVAAGDAVQTLLHRIIPPDGEVVSERHVELATLLLDSGAEVDALGWGPNNGLCTPLTLAAWGGHSSLVRLFLDGGAAPNGPAVQIARRHRPIDTAAEHGHGEVVQKLIEAGADYSLAHVLKVGLVPQVQRLLANDPDAAGRSLDEGSLPLHLAVVPPKADELIPLILEHGADPNACDERGRTALHAALEFDRTDVVHLLIEQGAEVDLCAAAGLADSGRVGALLAADRAAARTVQPDGTTALFFSAWSGDERSTRLLLEAGAEPSPRSSQFWACLTPLHVAILRKHPSVARLLLEQGADPDAHQVGEGRYWPTPLHVALRFGSPEDVALVLDHGADPNAGEQAPGAFGTSGLAWAVFAGDEAAVRRLIDAGLDLKHPNHREALHAAAMSGNVPIARLLIENGANVVARDGSGDTPLMLAERHRKSEMVRFLTEA